MSNGDMGKMVWVDLTQHKIREEVLEEKLCRDYIGGYGIGAKILFDRMKPGADPIGSEAIFGIVTGPFDGTGALGGSRYTVVGKSPLTGGWGDANSGGNFGPYLKYGGFFECPDGLGIHHGRSAEGGRKNRKYSPGV